MERNVSVQKYGLERYYFFQINSTLKTIKHSLKDIHRIVDLILIDFHF
jgi:hypothetical protein